MKFSYKDILPEYPSIRHLPWKPNNNGDKVVSEVDASVIFKKYVSVQEKVDAANCGMSFLDGYPVLRSRSKLLRKGQELKNPSQKQFASCWTWMYENKNKFDILGDCGSYSVYGEWMVQQHGMFYDKLPDWFIAYDIYDYERKFFLSPEEAMLILRHCGFKVVDELFYGKLDNYEQLEELANGVSSLANLVREGVIVKMGQSDKLIAIYKMVRVGFEQGSLLGDSIKKNVLIKK